MRKATAPNGVEYGAKSGVEIDHTDAQLEILRAASDAYSHRPQDLVVTSGNEGFDGDGVHMDGSLHYDRKALDLRVWDLEDPQGTADEIREILGPDFDVVFEGSHIHAEHDPAS